MRIPSRSTIQHLRGSFPPGCRVELIRMQDPQAPPLRTVGSVIAVDDLGTIHVRWDDGSSLGVAYGEDACRRIDNE